MYVRKSYFCKDILKKKKLKFVYLNDFILVILFVLKKLWKFYTSLKPENE